VPFGDDDGEINQPEAIRRGRRAWPEGRRAGVRQRQAMIGKRRFAESLVRKRSIKIGGRTTSVALEDKFWEAISEIAILRNLSIRKLVTAIDEQHEHANLSSAIRLYVLDHYRWLAEAAPGGSKGTRHKRP
jgi:predicted DNA-binding ribbon-helix-helix protein